MPARMAYTAIASDARLPEGNLDLQLALPDASDYAVFRQRVRTARRPPTSLKKTSIIASDSRGNAITYDVYFIKTRRRRSCSGNCPIRGTWPSCNRYAATGDSPFLFSVQ